MECIVHYPNLATYTLKDLSDNIIERVNFAKEKRIRLGGRNQHLHQCEQIPDIICPADHKIYLECSKMF